MWPTRLRKRVGGDGEDADPDAVGRVRRAQVERVDEPSPRRHEGPVVHQIHRHGHHGLGVVGVVRAPRHCEVDREGPDEQEEPHPAVDPGRGRVGIRSKVVGTGLPGAPEHRGFHERSFPQPR